MNLMEFYDDVAARDVCMRKIRPALERLAARKDVAGFCRRHARTLRADNMTVCRWAKGRVMPQWDKIEKLTRALHKEGEISNKTCAYLCGKMAGKPGVKNV